MKKVFAFLALVVILATYVEAQGTIPPDQLRPAAEKLASAPGMAIKPLLPGNDSVVVAAMKYSGDLGLNIYYPAGYDFARPMPPVILFNGLADEEGIVDDDGAPFKDLGMTISWAMAIAATGHPAVTYDSFEEKPKGRSAKTPPPASTEKLFGFLREKAKFLGIDPAKIGLYSMGATSKTLQLALADPKAKWLKAVACAVFNWPFLDPDFLPVGKVPILIVRPEKASAGLLYSIDEWSGALGKRGFEVEVHSNPSGNLNYELILNNGDSLKAITRIIEFLNSRL